MGNFFGLVTAMTRKGEHLEEMKDTGDGGFSENVCACPEESASTPELQHHQGIH